MAKQLKVKSVSVHGVANADTTMHLDLGDNIQLRVRARKGQPLEIVLESNTTHRISLKPHSSKSLSIVVEEP